MSNNLNYGLYEIESLAKRAARGAGLDWGLAEEAGKALRWLLQRELPGPTLFVDLLTAQDKQPYADLAPLVDVNPWHAPGGCLSPLLTGPALSDRAKVLAADGGIKLAKTAAPLLLAPYLANVAKHTGKAVVLTWQGVEIMLTASETAVTGEMDQVTVETAPRVEIRTDHSSVLPDHLPRCKTVERCHDLDDEVRTCLEAFAQRTYAPATDASRLAGAGAGLSDND